MLHILNTLIVKSSTMSDSFIAMIPDNAFTNLGLTLVPIAATFDTDVKTQINPVIKGFVYIMYALTLVFVILGIMKARSEDKQAAMWYLILAAIIGIAGLVVKNIFKKVVNDTQIDF